MRRFAKRILFVVACLFLLGGYTAAFFKIKAEPYAIGETLYFTAVLVMLTAAVVLGVFRIAKPTDKEHQTARGNNGMSDDEKKWMKERRSYVISLAIVSFACGVLAVKALGWPVDWTAMLIGVPLGVALVLVGRAVAKKSRAE